MNATTMAVAQRMNTRHRPADETAVGTLLHFTPTGHWSGLLRKLLLDRVLQLILAVDC